MTHLRKRPALGLESVEHLARVHAGQQQLDRHRAFHRRLLHGEVNRAHPAMPELTDNSVWADLRWRLERANHGLMRMTRRQGRNRGCFATEQAIDLTTQQWFVRARAIQKR